MTEKIVIDYTENVEKSNNLQHRVCPEKRA